MQGAPSDVTQLLIDWRSGDRQALASLTPLVYEELCRIAHARLRQERQGHTLSTEDLVHEVYVRLIDGKRIDWQSRTHFYAVSARAMRQILVSYARKRRAEKRGGGQKRLTLEEGQMVVEEEQSEALLALDGALEELSLYDGSLSQLVECRYFGGLTVEETAEVLGLSVSAVKRQWRFAKAWLYHRLKG